MPYCTTRSKIPDSPGDSFYLFISFLIVLFPPTFIFYFLQLAALQNLVDQQTRKTYPCHYLPLQPTGTCKGHEQLASDTLCRTWWVWCYQLGRIRPPHKAIITTGDLYLNSVNESKRNTGGWGLSDEAPQSHRLSEVTLFPVKEPTDCSSPPQVTLTMPFTVLSTLPACNATHRVS